MADYIKNNSQEGVSEQPGTGSIDRPWEYYYTMGEFKLSMGEPYTGLDAYAKAVQLSPGTHLLETALESLEKLRVEPPVSAGCEWARLLLIVAGAVRATDKTEEDRTEAGTTVGNMKKREKAGQHKEEATADRISAKGIKKMAICRDKPIRAPVIIVAGGCDDSVEEQMKSYRQILLSAFSDYKGTVIGGGTEEGISGLVGDLAEEYPNMLRTIGYLPGSIPGNARIDYRYRELYKTGGSDFSPLEPLQYWIDIIASGMLPAEIKLIGFNGGDIAAIEYKVALALGATAGLIANSGREADKLLRDKTWSRSPRLLRLSPDALAIKAFIDPNSPTPD